MERDWLERELAAGRSIEAIARGVGRDPSTVAYWVNKHGLASRHAAKHAARGGSRSHGCALWWSVACRSGRSRASATSVRRRSVTG